ADAMPEKVAEMDTIRKAYVDEVDGGTAQEVREALYKLMDIFSERSKEGYHKKLAQLKEENPADLAERKAALLKDLNKGLIKNEMNKEKCRRQAENHSWREGISNVGIQEYVESKWEDYTGE
ncbi:MAG: hypothetical protein AAF226_18295, partial [Verrucomicrobiota bacterium]